MEDFSGEIFTYSITWFGIKAGDAVLEVHPVSHQNKLSIKVSAVVSSARWFSGIYYVEDYLHCIMDIKTMTPFEVVVDYKEGKTYRRYSKYTFDYRQRKIFSSNPKEDTLDMPEEFMSFFGAFYLLRMTDFSTIHEIVKCVVDGRKAYQVTSVYAGKEMISSILGKKECLHIKPSHVQWELGGKEQDPDQLSIYFTNDSKRIPVLAKGKLRIGSLIARLVKIG
ncbi:MAG: DUF3108 domain-containing protein [Candidatus Aureabacteria bacterium]|nr:DUF3108 domain-containing protein [Candidatus Auribacterota bacterium]